MSYPVPELVFSVPAVDLHQVISGQQTFLSQGPFNVSMEDGPSGQVMMAEVPGFKWQLATHLACLKSNEFTYIFAVDASPDFFFCILLAADTPKEIQAALDAFLTAVTAFTTSLPLPEASALLAAPEAPPAATPTGIVPAPSSRIAAGITTSSSIIAVGLMKAAELAARGIEKGAQMAVQRTRPLDKPHTVSPEMQANLERAKMLAATAATFSKTVASGVGSMAATVAGHIVDAVSNATMVKKTAEAHPQKVTALGEIGTASVLALSHMIDTMENAARLVVRSSSSAAAKVIEHRYGSEAGAASRTGLDAAKHMLEAAMAMKQLKAKAILKVTAKHTASGLVKQAGPSGTIAAPPAIAAHGSRPAPTLPMTAMNYQLPEPAMLNGVPVHATASPTEPPPTVNPPTVNPFVAPAYPQYPQPGGAYPAYPQPQ